MQVIEEAHKGTRGGPSDPARSTAASTVRYVELSHVISDGLITYPGLPGPEITPHLTREDSRARYEPGTEFAIDRITMVGNTGTYLDSPFHRYADGADLAGLPLRRWSTCRSRSSGSSAAARVASTWARWPRTTSAGARCCCIPAVTRAGGPTTMRATRRSSPKRARAGSSSSEARLVGIDSVNIDDMSGGSRPAHSLLLAAGIPVVEHLTNLDQVPPTGARFFAAPPLVRGFGTFPVRAYVTVS